METLMQQLLTTLTTSHANVDQIMHMNTMLQELRLAPGVNGAAASPQERPEMGAIREALLSGDKLKAIKLYRSAYGVGLKEAQDALNAM